MSPPATDGSSMIFNYELQIMLPKQNNWQTVLGESDSNLDLTYTLTNDLLQPAQFVQARFRCQNLIGLGAFSDSVYMLMAGAPTAPAMPTYISSTDTSITVQFYATSNSNGSPITGYEVWRDLGDGMSELVHKESTYDGTSMQFTLSGLTPGKIYKIANLA
jgi:hypothetical protein